MERGGRKIAGGNLSARAHEMAGKAAASAGDFENTEARDGAEIFEDQLIPRGGGVVVSGSGVEDALVPSVVVGAEGHG